MAASGDPQTETKIRAEVITVTIASQPEVDGGAEINRIDAENRRIPSQLSSMLRPRWGRKMVLSEQVSKAALRCATDKITAVTPSRCPFPRGDSQSGEIGGSSRRLRIFQDQNSMLDSSFGTCQSCRVPLTGGRPTDGANSPRTGKIWTDLEKWSRFVCRRLETGCNVCNRKPQRACVSCGVRWFPSCRHSWQSPRGEGGCPAGMAMDGVDQKISSATDSGGSHRVDGCPSIRRARRCRSGQ